MDTRNERLSELLRIIGECALPPGQDTRLEILETEMPLLVKELNNLLDEEFLAGYAYALDPTAPMLPHKRNQRRKLYEKPKRRPGRPRKNPEPPPRLGKHVSAAEPDED